MSAGSMNVRPVVHVDVINTLRRLESQVVVTWGNSLAEPAGCQIGKASRFLGKKVSWE